MSTVERLETEGVIQPRPAYRQAGGIILKSNPVAASGSESLWLGEPPAQPPAQKSLWLGESSGALFLTG